MAELMKIFLSLSISGSIIALILFALKPFLKDKVSKTWQYYIWLIVILRLLTPFSLEINIVDKLFSEADKIIVTENEIPETNEPINNVPFITEDFTIQLPQMNDTEVLQQEKPVNYWNEIAKILWLLWLGAAIMLLVRKVTSYHSFVRYIKAGIDEVTDDEVLEVYKKAYTTAGVKKPLKIYSNKLAASPMLVGILKPFIVLPDIEVEKHGLYNIFIHELTHYKRLDIIYKWLTQFAVCLHWFNPLIYLISNEVNRNCELSCDEAIIKELDAQEKRSYGDTLLASLKLNGNYSNTIVSITLNEDAALLKERLGAIMGFKRKSKLSIIFSMVLSVFITCGAMLTGVYAQTENTAAKNGNINSAYPAQMDAAALSIMEQTGNWDNVKPLLQYMSPEGITNLVNLYIEMAAKQETASNEQRTTEGVTPQPTPNTEKESPSIPINTYNNIPEHFTSGGIAKTTKNSNTYTYEGVIGVDKYQFGNPFPANKGEQLTFKLNLLEYVSSEAMNEDDSILGVILEPNDGWTKFTFEPISPNTSPASFPAFITANYPVTILNYSGKEVKYSFTLTIEPKGNIEMESANSNTNATQSEIDAQALEIIQNTGNGKYVEPLLPHMSSEGVDKVALEVMQKTGNWKYVEPMFSYMTNIGIDRVVALWNQKNASQPNKKVASNYYNKTDSNNLNTESQTVITTDYDELAKTVIQETNDLNSIVGLASLMSTDVLDEIVNSRVNTASDFNKTYALCQYMSTGGIDKLVKDYVDRTHDYGTVGAMLQLMSKEASNYVANKYYQESSDRTYEWIFSPYMK